MSIDVDNLPGTQNLIMETLAARVRTGERMWTFRTREAKAIEALAQLGLVSYKSGIIERTLLVWFTPAGEQAMLSTGYITPMLAQLDAMKAADAARLAENDPDANGVVRELSQGEIVRMLTEIATARTSRSVGAPDWIKEELQREGQIYANAAQVAAGSVWDAQMLDAKVS